MNEQIVAKLDRLADMQAQLDAINLHFDDLRKTILTPEILAQLDEIEAERKTSLETAQSGVDILTAEIKADVMANGASVKGAHLQAVWSKGRISWDTKGLEGAMVLLPELAKFRKEGVPSVSLRNV